MLTEYQVKNIIDKYKEELPKYRLNIAYEKITEHSYKIIIETIEVSKFTVNGKSVRFGQNIVFDNSYKHNKLEYEEVEVLNDMIMEAVKNLISMLIWQRSGSVITNENQLNESIKVNKED